MQKPVNMLKVKKNINGISFGLMKAWPHIKGWVVKRSRIPQAVQGLNHRFVRAYKLTPVNWKSTKYE